MITLTKKIKKDAPGNKSDQSAISDYAKRVSIRDKLLVKEVQEMEQNLPGTCRVVFSDPNTLSEFNLNVSPDEGYWKGGTFKFSVFVTEDYNMAVSKY